MKKIYMLAVGGTISYVQGNTDNKAGKELLSEAGCTDRQDVRVIVRDVLRKGSSELSVEDLFLIAKEANRAIAEGADGIVVTHGTDTLEETAFFLNLTVPDVVPLVVTGAMKHGAVLGADGGANVNAAITAASSELLKNEGCVVVFDDCVIPSWYVRKTHTQALDTFKSQFGPIGYFSEGKLRVIAHTVKPDFEYHFPIDILDKKPADVYIETVFTGNDGRMLGELKKYGYSGLVLEGVGGGHCSGLMTDAIKNLGDDFPVIMTSRTGNGEVLSNTYSGSPGSEVNMIKSGVIYSGILDSRKSRILLLLMLTAGMNVPEIREKFKNYSIFDH